MQLVERDAALQAVVDCLRSVAAGIGHTVLVSGEAGIGKTSLLKSLAAQRDEAELWWGACDALQVPQPLAPLLDIARSSDTAFGALLGADCSRAVLFDAVFRELQQRRRPTLFIVEDAHWADDATLDLLKFLGRRIDRAGCLLVISYRDDEVTPSHPLRRVLGELPSSLITRVELPRLSPAAVESLAHRALRSPAGLYAATRGNPFFVTELLRNGIDGVPRSVQDLVLARFARLSPAAQEIVKLASIVPAKIERRLVERILGKNVPRIEECLSSGLLTAADSALSFRHELARVAIETSLSEPAARALHSDVLDVLEQAERPFVSLARMVHHATRADDATAILRHAPGAALQAQKRGACREAAAHYRTALEHAGGVGNAERAEWLDGYARVCQHTDQLDESIAARLQLGDLFHAAGNVLGEGDNLSQLALSYAMGLRSSDADASSRKAIELLETLPPSAQLAGAYRVEAQLRMFSRECEASITWSAAAIRLADRCGCREIATAALSTLGTATMFIDYDAGCVHMRRAIELALADGLHSIAANTYSNLGCGSGELFRLREAQQYLTQAISFSQEHEIDLFRNYATAWLALCELHLGRWEDAHEHAVDVLGLRTNPNTSRVVALVALGRLRTRRGDDGAEMLDEALKLALASNTLQRLAPVRAARAEAAYLRGDMRAVVAEAQAALPLAVQHQHRWFSGELAYWMYRAGALDSVPPQCAEPFALEIAGHRRAAAKVWADLSCPYEQARALADGDTDDQRAAFALYEQLGARGAADALRRLSRAAGMRGLPRGMRASTQANPHELTEREFEVLVLLCEGLRNSEIAGRLCRSVRTVDHHLAAAFSKLGVSSRADAISTALRTGITSQNGQVSTTN